MGKAIRASVLILLLTCSAQAGWMGNESPAPPPSQPANSIQEPAGGEITTAEPATGEMPNGVTDIVTQVAWELFAVLPSLL